MRLAAAEQIPPDVLQCAVAHDLGIPRIHYAASKDGRLHIFIGPVAFVVGLLVVGLYLLYYESIFSWWPTWRAMLVLSIGIAWLLIGVWIMLTPLLSPRIQIFLCPGGLIYQKHRLHVIRWQQIEQLWKTLHIEKRTRIVSSYTLRRSDGMQFLLKSNLPHIERLGGFLEREATRYLLPQALAAYKAGTSQQFADIVIAPDSITLKHEHKTLSWHDVEDVRIDKATISIYRKGDSWDWATLSVSDIPNIGVIKGLVEYILRMTGSTQSPHIQAYNAGFAVFFGKLSINKVGLSLNNGEELLPWSEIASIGVGESEVLIRRKNQTGIWQTLPIWTIMDAPALKELVNYILS